MDTSYIYEAFQALDMLNEDAFNLSDEADVKSLADLSDEPLIADVEIIDGEADTEEDLKPNYIGNVILDCNVCHSLSYKNPEEVEIDEESGFANATEECPFCFSTDGFTIVGMVAPYGDEAEDEDESEDEPEDELEDEEETPEEDAEIDIEIEDADEDADEDEDLEEGLFDRKSKIDPAESKNMVKSTAKELSAIVAGSKNKMADLNKYWDHIQNSTKIWKAWQKAGSDGDVYVKQMRTLFSIAKNAADVEEFNDNAKDFLDSIKNESLRKARRIHRANEAFESADIETDEDVMTLETTEDGGISFNSTPKSVENEDEVIAPVDFETQDEINPTVESEDEPEDEIEEAEDEDSFDIDSIGEDEEDAEEFDELGEAFFKKNYNNVRAYKTESIRERNNKLYVEGIITFKSGARKKTTFVFESAGATKNGRARLLGENLELKGGKAFVLRGNIKKNTFIPESMRYNLKNGLNEGVGSSIHGVVRRVH